MKKMCEGCAKTHKDHESRHPIKTLYGANFKGEEHVSKTTYCVRWTSDDQSNFPENDEHVLFGIFAVAEFRVLSRALIF